ncbi:type II toxin-antitoxin system VapC family toxin [Oceaniradius stylonematis]|jgi:PIN domain nuclease of toxin-antitoxin system|uniref:type II toxin-antitoxin system VapC family toxin n=1 Tax=Oceaniradius stylonematis TaxID=2184161 RepID=UPI0035CF7AA4
MRLLLDTHTLAWWFLDDPKLSRRARDLIADTDNEVFVSAVSAFEAATKFRIGKWNDIGPLAVAFEPTMLSLNYPVLSISAAHAGRAGLMAGDHRDPFDRLLAAQAEIDGLALVTNDRQFTLLGSRTIW